MPPRLSSADELAELTKIKREVTLDVAQMGLDVAGLFDPSPVSDGASAGLSLGRAGAAVYEGELLAGAGHALDAGLSAVSAIPYLGDLVSKPFKFIRTATRLGKHVDNLGRLAKKGSDEAVEMLKALESKICGKPGFEAICKKIKEALGGADEAASGTGKKADGTQTGGADASPKHPEPSSSPVPTGEMPSGPTEPYNRRKHYGNTPTKADRKAIGGEEVDHDPPLVQRYYEGDPAKGEPPGYLQTGGERKASASDRDRMRPGTEAEQRRQGGEMSQYSKEKKKEHGLK